jgi:hypothetical protein
LPRHAPAHHLAGRLRFFEPQLGRSARPHVPGSQIEHAGAIAHLGELQQRAAAGLFDIVRVGRNR